MIPFTCLKCFRLGDIFADMISVLVNIYVLYVHRPVRLALSSKIQADLISRKKIFERTYGVHVCAVPPEFLRVANGPKRTKGLTSIKQAIPHEDAAPCRL